MKICIPTLGRKGLEEKVSPHFGSAPTFTLYDLDNTQIEVIDNDHEHHDHGMCHPLESITGKNVGAVVCGGMGRRAVAGLNAGGIRVFLCEEGTVADIIGKFKTGTIPELSQEGACGGHHGCHSTSNDNGY